VASDIGCIALFRGVPRFTFFSVSGGKGGIENTKPDQKPAVTFVNKLLLTCLTGTFYHDAYLNLVDRGLGMIMSILPCTFRDSLLPTFAVMALHLS
jgi:hypothetical protein